MQKKVKPKSYLAPCTKIHVKCVTDLHIKARTINFIEKSTEQYFQDLKLGKDFAENK